VINLGRPFRFKPGAFLEGRKIGFLGNSGDVSSTENNNERKKKNSRGGSSALKEEREKIHTWQAGLRVLTNNEITPKGKAHKSKGTGFAKEGISRVARRAMSLPVL